jgi:hypothetical protein
MTIVQNSIDKDFNSEFNYSKDMSIRRITLVEKNRYIMCYTRTPQDEMIYASKLAYSMHLAYSEDGNKFKALNHNSGILFAKATDNEDGSMNAKSLKNPYLFYMEDDSIGVLAVRTDADGKVDTESKGKVLFFITKDLLQYKEVGLINLHSDVYVEDVTCTYDSVTKMYIIRWCDANGDWFQKETPDLFSLDNASKPVHIEAVEIQTIPTDIEGIVPRNTISISKKMGERLKFKLSTPYNVSIEVPEEISISSPEELKRVKVKALYNDGTTSMKTVDWNTDEVDWNKPVTYEIIGSVHQDHYAFPSALNRADPCCSKVE